MHIETEVFPVDEVSHSSATLMYAIVLNVPR